MITPEQLAGDSEDSQQKALMCWCAINQQSYPELRWLFHCPNGGSRNKIEAAKLKAMGVRPGVPDLFLPVPRGEWKGLFIELKTKKGKPSEMQIEWIDFLLTQGYGAMVCVGWEQARDTLVKYLEWK